MTLRSLVLHVPEVIPPTPTSFPTSLPSILQFCYQINLFAYTSGLEQILAFFCFKNRGHGKNSSALVRSHGQAQHPHAFLWQTIQRRAVPHHSRRTGVFPNSLRKRISALLRFFQFEVWFSHTRGTPGLLSLVCYRSQGNRELSPGATPAKAALYKGSRWRNLPS